MTTVTFTRGDTFSVFCQRVKADGAPYDRAATTLAAQIRLGTNYDTLDVAITKLLPQGSLRYTGGWR